MRLSRIIRQSDSAPDPDAVPLRRLILWIVVGTALVVGVVLYFKYERLLVPLVG
jgi:type VI protein secretion system component VasF